MSATPASDGVVKTISGIRHGYAVVRGKKYIEFKCRLELGDGFPSEGTISAAMQIDDFVTRRCIHALAQEFLP